ncbi:MAG: ribonuclease HI [Gammaproteobacteria bacterium]|nr:ribonuclease HI [Gammaproteobacteria bacterium]
MEDPHKITKVKSLKDLPLITGDSVHTVYTDGACKGNPGIAGWAAIMLVHQSGQLVSQIHLSGSKSEGTNNQMELLGPIMALESIDEPSPITIITDSKYVKDGITSWIHGWKRNNWITAARKPVKNRELWQRLDRENSRHNVTWQWVKGHAGNQYNEIADQLASDSADALRVPGSTPSILHREVIL